MGTSVPMPYRYGMEYELQLVVKNVDTGFSKVITVVRHFDRELFPKGNTSFLKKDAAGTPFITVLSAEADTLVLRDRSYPKELFTDMGNIEIKNSYLHQTIDSCIEELNGHVDIVANFLSESLPKNIQFSLLLPKCILQRTQEGKLYENSRNFHNFNTITRVSPTKHLNFSYRTNCLTLEHTITLLGNFQYNLRDFYNYLCIYDPVEETPQLISNSSEFLQYKNDVMDYSSAFFSLESEVSCFSDTVPFDSVTEGTGRGHVKVPYGFTKYMKIFDGTLSIADYEDWNKDNKEDFVEKQKPIMLGSSSKILLRGKRPWLREALLV